jgi:hypothetical protein
MEQRPPQGLAGEWRPYWLSGQVLCRTSTGVALRGGRGEKERRRSGMTEQRKIIEPGPFNSLESGVLISSQGSPSVEPALARLSGEVGETKEQRRSGMTEQRK